MKVSPYILLSLTSLFWSLNFIIGKLVAGAIPPATITFFRWGLPLLFYLFYDWQDIKINLRAYKEHWLLLLVLGVTGYSLNSITVYEAVLYTSTINTSFINAFNPVFIAIIGFALYRYPTAKSQVVGFIISFLGVAWIIFKGNLAAIISLDANVGDIIMMINIIIWSVHTVLYKRYADVFSLKSLFTMMMLSGVITTIPFVIIENTIGGTGWITQVSVQHIFGIICLSVFPSVLAYRFWNQALTKVPANKVAVFQYLIPVYTVIISLLFLGEDLQYFQFIGGVLIIAGVLLVTYKRSVQPQACRGEET